MNSDTVLAIFVAVAVLDGGGCSSEPSGSDPDIDAPAGEVDGATTDAAGGTDGGTSSGCAQADHFLDVSQAPGAGAGYPAPTLTTSCTATTLRVQGNGIPPYTFVAITPNALRTKAYDFTITRAPTRAAAVTNVNNTFGKIGVAVNGLVFYAAMEGAQPAAEAFGDPIYNGITDGCLGHTSPNEYHFHALSQQCLDQDNLVATPWTSPAPPATEPSPVLGYAFDGFPILGRYECSDVACTAVIELLSSWDQIGDPTRNAWTNYQYAARVGAQYLDRCNGHVGPAGDYHYHATSGFPYTIGCFAGTPAIPAGM